jgi:hypothetical protein
VRRARRSAGSRTSLREGRVHAPDKCASGASTVLTIDNAAGSTCGVQIASPGTRTRARTVLCLMSRFFLPPRVSLELQEESRRREAEATRAMVGDDRMEWKREFDAQLERVVHGMRLAFCPDPAPLDAVAQGAYPGRTGIWCGRGSTAARSCCSRSSLTRRGRRASVGTAGSWSRGRGCLTGWPSRTCGRIGCSVTAAVSAGRRRRRSAAVRSRSGVTGTRKSWSAGRLCRARRSR